MLMSTPLLVVVDELFHSVRVALERLALEVEVFEVAELLWPVQDLESF